jgi:hypothetical protein
MNSDVKLNKGLGFTLGNLTESTGFIDGKLRSPEKQVNPPQ